MLRFTTPIILGLLLVTLPPTVLPAAEPRAEDEAEWDVSKPHGPHETIAFDVTEGTWMSADVSPDGKRVLFDLLGDLYTVPIGGGDATRLTEGMAWDYQPRYSPDGTEILFTSDRGGTANIWIAKADGTSPRAFTEEKDHVTNCGAWSPDGSMIITKRRLTDWSSIGTAELWMVHRTGGSGIQITKKDDLPEVNEPIFHPDGRFIYFSARPSRFEYDRNPYQGIYEIRRYDRETGETTVVTSRYGGAGRPSISPDGTRLSFISREDFHTVLILHDLTSGAEREITGGLDHDLQESFAWAGVYPGMDWTPDGRHIVLSAGGKLWQVDVDTGEKIAIPFTAHVEQTIQDALRFPHDVTSSPFALRTLRWIHESPKDHTILFSAIGRLYAAGADGSTPRLFLRDDDDRDFEYAPRYSPDGKWVAYVTWNDDDKGQVWKARSNGTGRKQITTIPGQYANPNWSADGKRIVYLRGSGATLRGDDLGDELWHEIYIIDADGGAPRYVTSVANRGAEARMPNPTFGPEDHRIYFMEDDERNTVHFASIEPNGIDKRIHAKVKYGEEFALSPDGRWLAYKHLHDAYLAPLPLAGKEPLELSDSDGAVAVMELTKDLADWIHWTDDHTLTWAAGSTFHRQTLEKVLAAAEAKRAKEEEEKKSEEKKKADESESGSAEKDGAEQPKSDSAGNETAKTEKEPDPNATEAIEIELKVPRAAPSGTLVVDGARLITMQGDEVIERGTIVIEGNRITALGKQGEVAVPEGAEVVDATGLTAIPGLVDTHSHMGYGALDILPQEDWRYYANLAYGVTATMDPSASTHLVFAQSEMVEAGVMKGPRIYSTGFILYGADVSGKAPINSLDDARRHVKRLEKVGAFAVKSYMQPRREQRQWVIEAAREEKMLVFPEGGGNFEENMGMILDGHTGVEHAVPVAPLYDDVVQLWKRTKVGYTPTLLVAYGGLSGENWFYEHEPPIWQNAKLLRFTPRAEVEKRSRRLPVYAYDGDWNHITVAASATRLSAEGVLVNLGAHGQRQGLGAHWELWGLAQGGMEPHEVLRCGTIHPATYIGLDEEIGSLEVGKLADVVLLARNPLEDIHNTDSARYVIKNGELFDAESMNELYPQKITRRPFLWE